MPTTYAIPNGRTVMDATLWTGTGNVAATQVNTDLGTVGFKPDFVWIKARSVGYSHTLYDSVRGTGPSKSLYTDTTEVQGFYSAYTNLTSFTSTGFTTGVTSNVNILNDSAKTFVAWQWQAGQGTTANNTSGSVTSSVSVNTTSKFSIMTFAGAAGGGAYTIGHGIGTAPDFIIVKDYGVNTANYVVYHSALGNTYYMLLGQTDAKRNDYPIWNNTSPTSTVFTWNAGNNSNNYVAYAWAAVPGFSAFGTYTGNGSSDGPFIYTGFRPKFILVKAATSTNVTSWAIFDSSRNPYNQTGLGLFPNIADAEANEIYNQFDLLSNGFKLRPSNTTYGSNQNNGSYIYAAFAENPFKYANAR